MVLTSANGLISALRFSIAAPPQNNTDGRRDDRWGEIS